MSTENKTLNSRAKVKLNFSTAETNKNNSYECEKNSLILSDNSSIKIKEKQKHSMISGQPKHNIVVTEITQDMLKDKNLINKRFEYKLSSVPGPGTYEINKEKLHMKSQKKGRRNKIFK